METQGWIDPETHTVELVEPEIHTDPDSELEEVTEADAPTVVEAEEGSDAWVALQFVKGEGPPPETVLHRPGEPVDSRTPMPTPAERTRPHLDAEFNPGAQAAEGLQLLGAIQKLRGLIQHEDPLVRRAAVDAVGAMAGPAIALTLRPMLADPDEGVRAAARAALLTLKG